MAGMRVSVSPDLTSATPASAAASPKVLAMESVRPKVMRRPAHFSGQPHAEVEIEPLAAPVSVGSAPLALDLWQENVRFCVMLVGTLLLMNLLLVNSIARIRPVPQVITQSLSTTPVTRPETPSRGDVRIYTKPPPAPRPDAPYSPAYEQNQPELHVLGERSPEDSESQ